MTQQHQDTRFDELVALINATPADQLERTIGERPGGVDGALDVVFDKMASLFNPAKAKNGKGVFQHEITCSDGTKLPYYLRVADGVCTSGRGSIDGAEVTLVMKVVDMLHIANGKLSGQKAFLTGKVKIRGNPFFGMKLGDWFNPM
jgi:putative sterol carrier protein